MNLMPEANSHALKEETGGAFGPDAKVEALVQGYYDATMEVVARIDGEDWEGALRLIERRDRLMPAIERARGGATPRILPVLREILDTEQRWEGRLEEMKKATMAEIDSLHQMARWARTVPFAGGGDPRFVDTQG
jgi:hypothetical protein